MTCDGCGRDGVFHGTWDVHLDLRTMEVLCTPCFVERLKGGEEYLTARELRSLGVSYGLPPR